MNEAQPRVGVVMGSASDWPTLQHASAILAEFGVPHECKVVSAHRMPDDMFAYAEAARGRGLAAIIAGAGGAAHLPGMLAAKTPVPVLGVPVPAVTCRAWIRCIPSCRCPRACRWPPSPSARPARPTRRCSRWRCWPTDDPALRARLDAFRARQTEAARAMTAELK
jgi:5-(carboxyamino)imidazole ribonucleotide mutase